MTLVTFIIPVRHQDNARDWGQLTTKLRQTMASIASQTHPDWRCIIVANEMAELPPLPDKFSVTRVTFPPNDLHDLGKASEEVILDAFRFDKGRRVLKGMLDAPDTRFFMLVDDDDLVSNRIVEHVAANPDANGWYVSKGYLWNDGSRIFCGVNNFNDLCGSSLIIRADSYEIPATFESASTEWIKDMLGSHRRIRDILKGKGAPLRPLPFRGAVYRVGNAGSHSGTLGIGKLLILNRNNIRRPDRSVRALLRLRHVGAGLAGEFFGASDTVS